MDLIALILQKTHLAALLSRKLDLALSVHGISFTEFMILHHLGLEKELKLSRVSLSEKVGITPSGVTRILLPMEKNHLVARETNPRDARQSLVILTEAGQEVCRNSTVTVQQTAEAIFSLLTPEELEVLAGLLHRIKY